MTKNEIHAYYLALHDALGSPEDALDKELFDQQHRQIWHDCDVALCERKSYLQLQETLTPEQLQELTELLSMFPPPAPTEPPPIFTPLPTTGLPEKVTHIEDFLSNLYPPP